MIDFDVDAVIAALAELKAAGVIGVQRCPCCGQRIDGGCAAGCAIGMPAWPAQGSPEHEAVCEYASLHGLTFACAHAELTALASRRARSVGP